MPRLARIVIPNYPHHIVHRGVRKENIFQSDDDRRVYLSLFKKGVEKFSVKVLGYCLMDNHVHFILLPNESDSIGLMIQKVHGSYARYYNAKYGFAGHLFEFRFFSCVMDLNYTLQALRYVDLNPVKAGIVKQAFLYPWSSAATHLFNTYDQLIDDKEFVKYGSHVPSWHQWLELKVSTTNLEKHLENGLPLGNEFFLEELRTKYQVQTTPRRKGRPPGNCSINVAKL